MLTEQDIVWYMRGYASLQRHQWITPNAILYPWESDLLTVTPEGLVHEIEIKCTRSDLRQDLRKPKHLRGLLCNGVYPLEERSKQGLSSTSEAKEAEPIVGPACRRPNFFSFAMPCRVYRLHPRVSIPAYAGVFTVDEEGRVREERPPKALHPKRILTKDLLLLSRKIHHRYWNEIRRDRHDPGARVLMEKGLFGRSEDGP